MLKMNLSPLAFVLRQYLIRRVTLAVNLLVKKIGLSSLEEPVNNTFYILYFIFYILNKNINYDTEFIKQTKLL